MTTIAHTLQRSVSTGRLRPLALCCLFVCLFLQGCGFGLKIDAGLAEWSVDGDISLSKQGGGSSGLRDTANEYGNVLGLDGRDATPYTRIEAKFEKTSLSLATLWYDESGSGRLANAFGDLLPGEFVTSQARFVNFRLVLSHDFYELGDVTISPGVGINYVEMDTHVSSLAADERADAWLPIPSLYVKTSAKMGPFVAELDLGLGAMWLPSTTGTVADVEAMLRWHPFPMVEVFTGYRLASFHLAGESRNRSYWTDFRLHGWLLGFKLGP